MPGHGGGGGGSGLFLVYCSTPIGLNLVNFEIFTGDLSYTAETISLFDTAMVRINAHAHEQITTNF